MQIYIPLCLAPSYLSHIHFSASFSLSVPEKILVSQLEMLLVPFTNPNLQIPAVDASITAWYHIPKCFFEILDSRIDTAFTILMLYPKTISGLLIGTYIILSLQQSSVTNYVHFLIATTSKPNVGDSIFA